jgi:prolipoprotein diacylglyceryltransferase
LTFPWQLEIGSSQIPYHVIFETAGIFIGFRYFLYLRSKSSDAISSSNRLWILIGAIFGSVIGSRLIGGLENPGAMVQAKNILFHFVENKTIVGGLLGGLAGVELMKKRIGERQRSGDLFTYPLLLAMIIGRIGCFSMGVHEETYGTVTNSPFGIDLGDGEQRHPVALYEIAFLMCLWVAIFLCEKKHPLAPGARFKIFMIAYLVFRFLLDFIKPHYTFPIALSTIQLTCILGLLYYSADIIKPGKLFTVHA